MTTPLRVIAFEGGWSLPIWAAQRQGFFEANGIQVSLEYTPSSVFLVTALLEGKYDIGMAGIDNIVAYQEGQGEAAVAVPPDLFAFLGADEGFLSVVAAPAITRFANLAGKKLSVDAMSTGFAFVLRELVARSGIGESQVTYERAGSTGNRYRDLVAGKHDATLLRTPFELMAQARGCHQLATATALGPYQGTVGAARRSWAQRNEATLVAYVRAYRAALDWLYHPDHRQAAEALLVANMSDMTPALAAEACALLLAERGGMIRDAALNLAGIETVLALRSKYGRPQKTLTDPSQYIDTRYHRAASETPAGLTPSDCRRTAGTHGSNRTA